MYLRPGSLFTQFIVERKMLKTDAVGRMSVVFAPTFNAVRGILCDAKTSEIIHWKALSHPVTHTIVQHLGQIAAREGDRLVHEGRCFYVQGVDDVSMLGQYIIYYVEERGDSLG